MTVTELKTLLTDLLSFNQDNVNIGTDGTLSDANAVLQLNRAKNVISRALFQWDPSITFTMTTNSFVQNLQDTTTPVVSRTVIKPLRVIVNSSALYNYSGYPGLVNYTDFENYQGSSWRSAAAGQPTTAVAYNEGSILLYPKPDQAYSNSYIVGQYLAADLSASSMSASPDLPIDLHPAVAYLAAVMALEPVASESEQMNRLSRYEGAGGMGRHYVALIREIGSKNRRAWSDADVTTTRRKYI